MTTEDAYNEIYKAMQTTKEKGLKMNLKKNIQGVFLTNIFNVDPILDVDDKNIYIYHTQLRMDDLIKNIILENGNIEKIKIRNFFSKNHKRLWGQYPIF